MTALQRAALAMIRDGYAAVAGFLAVDIIREWRRATHDTGATRFGWED